MRSPPFRRLLGLAAATLLAQATPAAFAAAPKPVAGKCVSCFVIFVPPLAATKGKTILASRGVVSVEQNHFGGWLVTFAESVRDCALIATMRTNNSGVFGYDNQPVVVSTSLKSDKIVSVLTWASNNPGEIVNFVGFHLAPVC
jgi:hypothetical protein